MGDKNEEKEKNSFLEKLSWIVGMIVGIIGIISSIYFYYDGKSSVENKIVEVLSERYGNVDREMSYEQALEAVDREIVKLQNDNSTLQSNNIDLKQEVNELQSEVDSLQKEVSSYKQAIEVAEKEIEKLQNNNASEKFTTPLYAKCSDDTDKWGYVDADGLVVIPYIYDWADDFIDGYAAVRRRYRWGFIDSNGNEVISFDYNGAWSFVNGLAPVFNGDLWGFIDESNNVQIPFKYTEISRIYTEGKQFYLDENDEIINYEEEMNK